MKIVIAGGSGFLGRALTNALAADGHQTVVLTRGAQAGQHARVRSVQWTPNGSVGPWASEVSGADAVINLAGESIASRRWSDVQKRRIFDSRALATRSLAAAIDAAGDPPPVFVSGSAVGYYGPRGDEPLTEDAPAGSDFLAQVCSRWETEAERARSPRTRVVCVRTGLVLDRREGALPRMLPPFYVGIGGPIGSGRQYWPWIHIEDWVDLVRWTVSDQRIAGAINASAPAPLPNSSFARALGRALRRPAVMPTPAFVLRIVLGEMADALLLSGQRALPAKAQQHGFAFRYSDIDGALQQIFGR
jgi:uncharacterized protein